LASVERFQNGRYLVLKKLGEGGKGVVYKTRDTVLNRVVAIKMLKSAVSSEEAYSRFMREAQAVAKLNHPNIVSIHDIGKENEKQFFVLEFVGGTSLRELMKTYPEGKCDVQTVLRVGIDICSALQYAHSQGVLHRDVKPENILITEEGTAKLMDFGLAKMVDQPSITQEGIIVGTVAYVAPENALGKSADARSDLYSFGAVLYEMVTGKPPFPGEDPVKVIFGHIHDYPVSPTKLNPKVPQALVDCIMRLLEKEPEKRYQNAAALKEVLTDISEYSKATLAPSRRQDRVLPGHHPSALGEVQLIDRVEEMNILKMAVDKAVRGEGGIVFLFGEAGIGKTRLSKELGTYARLRGMQVLYGRCPALFRMDSVPPYVLWNEVIKDYIQTCGSEQLSKVVGYYPEEVSKLVPEVKQKLGTIPESLPVSPEHERERLFEAVTQLMTNISKEAPLLIVLDDLQRIDQSSLLLLHHMARGTQKESLLILGIYRDVEIDERHPLSPVLTELNKERLFQPVHLKRMSFNDTSEMIRQILEQDDVPTELCELVYEKTKGNPFFAEEAIKSLKEEEVIHREGNKWKIKEVSRIELPKTVKSVMKTRISRLDDECQNLLTLSSFVGNDFTFEAMRAVTGYEDDKLLQLMERIHETGLFRHRVVHGEDVCSFADVIVRDAVYEEVNPFRRKKLHGIVGNALEKVYAEKIDEHLGELALHFLESGDKDKALDYLLRAGEKATKVYAYNEAASYFESALRILEDISGEPRQKAGVLERLGDIKGIVGELDASKKYWNEALLLWTQLNEKKNISRLSQKISGVLSGMGDSEKSKEYLDMFVHMILGEWDKDEQYYKEAFSISQRLGDFQSAAIGYLCLGWLRFDKGEYANAREHFEKSYEVFEKAGARYSVQFLASQFLIWTYIELEETEKAKNLINNLHRVAVEVKDKDLIANVDALTAMLFRAQKKWKESMELFEKSVQEHDALNARQWDAYLFAKMVLCEYAQTYLERDEEGDREKAHNLLNQALELFQKIGAEKDIEKIIAKKKLLTA
jgi:tetratricopeptide (TPR) repeat protein/tRNA A-37 threonylcarbamoyl transferase component Bud32/ABC-type transporter Mla MlaB component